MNLLSFLLKKKRIFLDYASTTPTRSRVLSAMEPFWKQNYANPSSRHADGVRARDALHAARNTIAHILQVQAQEITFTSGGTEANNAALFGVVEALHHSGRSYESMHLVISAIEHPSVLEMAQELERRGVSLSLIPVTKDGIVTGEALKKVLRPETVLVSVMYVNNEIGSINPLRDLSAVIAKAKKGAVPYFHTDAAQAPLYLSVMPHALGVDLMTLDAQKMYGPKGVGLLYHSRTTPLRPFILGGSQEGGQRAGTPPVPLIVGLAKALELANRGRENRTREVGGTRDYLLREIQRRIPQVSINGPSNNRIANNLNFSIPGIEGEYLAALLDKEGVSASTKSACMELLEPSVVVGALYHDQKRAKESIRFALGEETTKRDVARVVEILERLAKKFDGAKNS